LEGQTADILNFVKC